jgi:hypothetical protein
MNKTETKRLERELIAEAKRLTALRKTLTDKLVTVDRRINHVERSLAGIQALLGRATELRMLPTAERAVLAPINPRSSISEGIRQLFHLNQVLSPPLIRDALQKAGLGKRHDNLLVQVHNNLKRLAYAGEIRAFWIGRNIAYERVSPLERAFAGMASKSAGRPKTRHPKR